MILRPSRVKKARRTGGRCPLCQTVIVTGQQIGSYPFGWCHIRCAAERRAVNQSKEEPSHDS